ncbi:hypothetical protein D3C80_814210 [compost metagenome]
MEPPIKAKSIQQITTSLPLDLPTPVRTASLSLVFSMTSFKRSEYFLVSTKCKVSLEVIFLSNSTNSLLSNKISKYVSLPILTWKSSSGLTYKLRANSSASIIFPVGDLYQSPFGTSILSSVAVVIPFSFLLNQAIYSVFSVSVISI